MSTTKRTAIIGAGASGLAAIKSCKEVGFEPVCFEKNGEPGGLWKYHDEDIEGVASVMKNTILNSSKEMSAFSDFPPPKQYPNFMRHNKMYKYFMMYADKFDLIRHIRYHMEVIKVEPTKDHEVTGRWIVSVKSSKTEAVTEEEFDAIFVCIGHHAYPHIPTFPGQEKFRGFITHSRSVKSCEQFSGKKVVVVGIGNSGVDVAVESTFVAKKVYLSTRRGSWIFSQVGINGRPFDMDTLSRKKKLLTSFMSYDAVCDRIEKDLNKTFDHEAYKLKPKHRVLSAHPTMSDALPHCIISGKIVVKGDINKFEENGVVFSGEDEVTKVDVVVLATGYLIKLPLLDNIVRVENNKVDLYKFIIPPALNHPTLGLIGLFQPSGPLFPIFEMQSRWFAQVLLGNVILPCYEARMKAIKARNHANAKRFTDSIRHTIQLEWISYMDDLASQIGVKPNLLKLAATDPKLFLACFSGPCLPYQYRLHGPHAWSGARDAILNYEKRVFAPLNSDGKVIPKSYDNGSRKFIFLAILLTIGIIAKRYLSFSNILNNNKIFNF